MGVNCNPIRITSQMAAYRSLVSKERLSKAASERYRNYISPATSSARVIMCVEKRVILYDITRASFESKQLVDAVNFKDCHLNDGDQRSKEAFHEKNFSNSPVVSRPTQAVLPRVSQTDLL